MQIKIKTKIFSLLLISFAGLLFGGTVIADGSQAQSANTQNVAVRIETIRQKINALSLQLEQQRIGQITIATTKTPITQEKINYIEAKLNVIVAKTAQLKIEVEIFVINRKIMALEVQMAQGDTEPKGQGDALQEKATSAVGRRITTIKQQIAELNQELLTKTAGTKGQSDILQEKATSAVGQCVGQNCSINATGQPISVQPTQTTTPQPEKKGFWQSVGDFLKKIFTF